MQTFLKALFTAVFLLSIAGPVQSANGATTPLSINLIPPVQFPPRDFTVVLARASALWGHQRNMYGIDVGGIGNRTDNNFVGLAVSGVFNYNNGLTTVLGLQAAGIGNINVNKATIFGVQVAAGFNINKAESSLIGVQLAAYNDSAHTRIGGLQVGLVNKARAIYGFQVGLINYTDSLHGIQIGLLNHNKSGPFNVAPIINIGF